jgi:hypothetical protein
MEPVNDYIDVRGAWPTYVRGIAAMSLQGWKRDVTLEEARELYKRANS